MISWPYQVSDLISQDIRTDTASDWLIENVGTVIAVIRRPAKQSPILIKERFEETHN